MKYLIALICSSLVSCAYNYQSETYFSFDENDKSIFIAPGSDSGRLENLFRNLEWEVTAGSHYVKIDDINKSHPRKYPTRYSLENYEMEINPTPLFPIGYNMDFKFTIVDNKTNTVIYKAWGTAYPSQVAANLAKDIRENTASVVRPLNNKRNDYSILSPDY